MGGTETAFASDASFSPKQNNLIVLVEQQYYECFKNVSMTRGSVYGCRFLEFMKTEIKVHSTNHICHLY